MLSKCLISFETGAFVIQRDYPIWLWFSPWSQYADTCLWLASIVTSDEPPTSGCVPSVISMQMSSSIHRDCARCVSRLALRLLPSDLYRSVCPYSQQQMHLSTSSVTFFLTLTGISPRQMKVKVSCETPEHRGRYLLEGTQAIEKCCLTFHLCQLQAS